MTTMPIVIAANEPQISNLIKFILSKHGMAVVEAKDGIDALVILREVEGKGVLVSDVRLPNLDGLSLCRMVKEIFPSVPVLLMSAIAAPESSWLADGFLRKPFRPATLVGMITDLCSMSAGKAGA